MNLLRDIILRCAGGLLITLVMCGVTAFAADPVKPAPPAPKITAEQQVTYFQTAADLAQAQAALMQAQQRVDAAIKAMQEVCPLVLDEQKRPQCKPTELAPEPAKK